MADNETIADITAEMRFHGQQNIYAEKDKPEYGILTEEGRIAQNYADRLEAAHKRERETSGNTAALHEALKPVKRYLDGYTVNILELRRTVDAALTAPTRNCDRFGSSTQARAEWYKTEVLPRVEGVVSGVEPPFVDWLFAPATEKEGGAK